MTPDMRTPDVNLKNAGGSVKNAGKKIKQGYNVKSDNANDKLKMVIRN